MSVDIEILRKFLKETKDDWNYILPTEFYQQYYGKKNNVVIDLRRKKEFHKFHIPGAQNIFWLDILEEKNIKKIRNYQKKGKSIFLICYVGHTSSQVAVLLKLLGIHVKSIKFGYGLSPSVGVPVAGWLQYQYPIISC